MGINRSPRGVRQQRPGGLSLLVFFFSLASVGNNLDQKIFSYINTELRCIGLDCLSGGIEILSSNSSILASHILIFRLGGKKEILAGRLALFACGSAGILSGTIKAIVNRQRPLGRSSRWDSSFPSGHATTSSALATIYGSKYPSLRIPLYAFSFLVGFSRVYSGEHYPSDVLAGWFLGYLTGRVILRYEKKIAKFLSMGLGLEGD